MDENRLTIEEVYSSGDGDPMGRAFREGVSKENKITMKTKRRSWRPLADLQGLTTRTEIVASEMGPLVEVPAMVRIENDKWIFERVSEETLMHLTHRLVIHESKGPRTLGATLDLETAMQVAQGMAMNEGSVVLIEPLRD